MSAQQTYRDRVAAYFKDRPYAWIDGLELEQVGGKYAWRTRVSDCRKHLGMAIENRVRPSSPKDSEGGYWMISEYRYVPSVESAEDQGHDSNSFQLR